jgi:hypothetical protein
MVYQVDYVEGEKQGCSCRIIVENRTFFVKLYSSPLNSTRYYAGDQNGLLKEISKTEFELWLKILTSSDEEMKAIQEKLERGRRY